MGALPGGAGRGAAWFVALVVASVMAGACAADEGAQPDPTLTTPGAFIGTEHEDGGVEILRVLASYRLDTGMLLIVKVYAPIARDMAEARALARDPDLPVRDDSYALGEGELVHPEVLWYRSLSLPEREAAQ